MIFLKFHEISIFCRKSRILLARKMPPEKLHFGYILCFKLMSFYCGRSFVPQSVHISIIFHENHGILVKSSIFTGNHKNEQISRFLHQNAFWGEKHSQTINIPCGFLGIPQGAGFQSKNAVFRKIFYF